jgi:beta-glucanase (GH16 family)
MRTGRTLPIRPHLGRPIVIPAPTTPQAPTNLVTVQSGSGQLGLTWTAPSNGGSAITDYIIQYRPKAISQQFLGTQLDPLEFTAYDRLGDTANSEVNAVVPRNARVTGGSLFIDSKFETVIAQDSTTAPPNPRSVDYTSAQVAQPYGHFRYGSVEVRAKICGGTGTWPCIWMLGVNWQPSHPFTADTPDGQANWPNGGWWEIDIAEFMSGHRTLQNCALHFITANRTVNGGASGEKSLPFDATTRFMVYRLEWTSTSLIWKTDAEDGNGFITQLSMTGGTPGTDIPNTAGFVLIHTAIGGFGGAPDSATYPVSTEVDYVNITPDWITFADGTSTATSTTVTGLENGVLYEFQVAAVNTVGQGPWSSAVSDIPGLRNPKPVAVQTAVRRGSVR